MIYDAFGRESSNRRGETAGDPRDRHCDDPGPVVDVSEPRAHPDEAGFDLQGRGRRGRPSPGGALRGDRGEGPAYLLAVPDPETRGPGARLGDRPGWRGRARRRKSADFCREALNALDLDEIFLDMLDALAKGYSMNEILWDASGNQAVIRDIRWIHPKKVTFWDSIHPRVLTEEEPVRGVDPQPFKWVYFRHKARSGYDTRAGIMRVCAWMYLFKNYGIKDWVIFTEVFGQPLRVGKYDQGASQADKDALLAAIRAIGTDAAGIISKNTEIEFVEAQQRTGSLNIYESLTRFCDNQTSKAILGQVLTSEAGGQKGEGIEGAR